MATAVAVASRPAASRSGSRASTSALAFATSASTRSSAFTPRPLRPDTLTTASSSETVVAEGPRRGGGEHDLLVGEVVGALRRLRVAEGGDARLHHPLRVGLADVDHVVDRLRVAERRGARLALAARRRPEPVPVVVGPVQAVAEVAVELPELPELVGDVLAGVGDGAVRADDDLVLVDRVVALAHGQHPAARALALRLQADGALLLQQLEGAVPEVQAQDVALVGQQVVADPEPRHRREVAVHDAARHVLGEARGLVPARLDRVEGLGLQRLVRRVGRVEVAHLRVEVPAVVVELPGDLLDLGQGLLLEVLEAHHHVRDLHARVVDVVLHADVVAAVAQHAHEGVAQAGVAEVADVGGLVGVDARVLDDDVARADGRRRAALGEARGSSRANGARSRKRLT